MPRFNVRVIRTITERSETWVEVEADDEDAAFEEADERARCAGIEWEACDEHTDYETEEAEEIDDAKPVS